MRRIIVLSALALASLIGGADAAVAQQGTLIVQVRDEGTRTPITQAQVVISGGDLTQDAGGLTDASGMLRLQLAPGTYSVYVTVLGYTDVREDRVVVPAGGSRTVTIAMTPAAVELEGVIVTGARREQKALEAPAAVSLISREQIQQRTALTPIEHVKNEPGMDVSQTGLSQSNVVARGFNNVFSGALLTITDNRYAFVPSLRVNAYNFIPSTDLDLEQIEIVYGPGAALYGPNSASGVLHMISASPIDRPGTTVQLAGGTRSVFQGAFRTAWANDAETFGFKVSGRYVRGDDWEYTDPVEQAAREEAIEGGADPDDLLIGARDFNQEVYSAEARLDFRPFDDGEIVVQGGVNNAASTIELTGQGAGQAQDWRYQYGQAWFNKGRFFAQGFMNASNAGDTYLLRTGNQIVDKSKMWAAQVQHGFGIGDWEDLTYGIDFQQTSPNTEGTINGANEDDDEITEWGWYVHSETQLTDDFQLVLALRMDDHSRLEDMVWSPRAALVWQPQENQNFRVTFNRAFSTPSSLNLFLDLTASRIPLGPGVGYNVQTVGVPQTGYNFTPGCSGMGAVGDFCMFSPFAPGNQLPANATLAWDALIQQLAPTLAPYLPNPGAQVGSILRRLDPEAAGDPNANPFPVDAEFLAVGEGRNIGRIQPTIYNTFELGYKGILADNKLSLSANWYFSRIEDFVGPLRVETPTVFLDPATTAQYVTTQLTPLVQAGALTPQQVAALIQGLASVPIGTVAPDERASSDILLTYRNFGEVDYWGADFGAAYFVTNRLTLRGSYAYVSKDCFDFDDDGGCDGTQDIALNAPQNKFSLSGRWDDVRLGWAAEVRFRWVDEFPMNSGVYVGTVENYSNLDLNLDYRIPGWPGASVGLTGTNILNTPARQFVGAPELGSLWLVRLRYDF